MAVVRGAVGVVPKPIFPKVVGIALPESSMTVNKEQPICGLNGCVGKCQRTYIRIKNKLVPVGLMCLLCHSITAT